MVKKLFSFVLLGMLSFGIVINTGASRSNLGGLSTYNKNVYGCGGTKIGNNYTSWYNSNWGCSGLNKQTKANFWALDRECRTSYGGHGAYPFGGYTYWGGANCWKID